MQNVCGNTDAEKAACSHVIESDKTKRYLLKGINVTMPKQNKH